MDNLNSLILLIGTVLFIVLLCLKTYGFKKATQRPSFKRWLFFTHVDIESSSSEYRRKLKRRQNRLSLLILIFLIVFLFVYLLYNSLRS